MPNFIEIVDVYGTFVSINIDHIVSLEKLEDGTSKITLTSINDGSSIIKYTQQSYDDIRVMI
ncbi:hypothetical protein SAMN05216524_104445 [Mucilaginibacter sp. OK098]|nr:hypothetical protein SAMN05216524_104445 [Mucilaginibacter sp. OK098]